MTVMLLASVACGTGAGRAGSSEESSVGPVTMAETGSATFTGIEDGPITLSEGKWRGEPFVEGGASAPAAGLVGNFRVEGDLDGDGADEAVVLLWSSDGGSGTFNYIAVMGRGADGAAVNLATAELGDRVRVVSAEILDGKIILDMVQHGPEDPMCCPAQKVRRTFELTGSELIEVATED